MKTHNPDAPAQGCASCTSPVVATAHYLAASQTGLSSIGLVATAKMIVMCDDDAGDDLDGDGDDDNGGW